MALDKATVARIARLARIDVPPEREEALAAELDQILHWIEQLGEVDTGAVEPLRSVVPTAPTLRADEVTEGDAVEAVLGNAPDRQDGFFVVPKVVE